jgi:phage shock protein PspC (stress-responsive transcriptional regulator)
MHNDTPPTQPAPPAAPAPDAGFFGWLRGLGIVREPGWLGGVAAGLAARIGIDPIIVRGIIVVLGVLGAPVLFLYAVAWLLLPDTTGRIHLQEVLRGTFDRAIAGIALMVILSALPFGGGWPWWGFGDGPWSFGGWISTMVWTVILVGAGIWLIVWLATRPSTRATTPGAAGAPGTPAAPGNSAADHTATDATAFAAASAPTTTSAPTGATPAPASGGTEPAAPPAPPSTADDAELASWREQQAQWRREHDAWRAQQAADTRAVQQQKLAEDRRRRQEEAAERNRVYREKEERTRPSSAFTLIAFGVALLAAGGTVLALLEADLSTTSRIMAALSVALGVFALAIIVNGIRGRRSGGSSAAAIVIVVSLLLTGAGGWLRGPLVSDRTISWSPVSDDRSMSRTVVSGDVDLDLSDYFAEGTAQRGAIELFVVSGDVDITMPANADSRVEVDVTSGIIRVDDEREGSGAFAGAVVDYESRTGGDNRRLLVDVYVVAGDITVTQAD